MSKSTIGRIWRRFELKPHLVVDGFKLSNDPLFVHKVVDVVGLYHNPPEKAVRMPERRSHDYARHGVTSLFAAFDITDAIVISALHRQHRAVVSGFDGAG